MTKNKILFSEKNRDSISFAITCGFYVILFVLFAVLPVSKPKKYTQISVQLDVPVAKKTENTQQLPQKIEEQKTETVSKEVPQKAETKTVEKPVEKQNTVTQQKTQTATTKTSQSSVQKQSTSTSSTKSSNSSTQKAQTTTQQTQQKQQTASVQEKTEPVQTVTKREVVYQKSIEELMAENAKKKKETSTWDDSIFGEENSNSSVVQSQNNSTQNLVKSQNDVAQTFEGVAASSSESQTVQTASESRFSGTTQNQVSSSTSDALNKISSTTYVAKNGSESISYETSGVLAPRQLLYPSEPSIVISESLEDKIARTKTVKISFVVKSDGSVDTKTIKIEPVGSLVPEIEAEIKGQISLWRFESGKSDGQATFNYSINVR